MCFVFQLSLSLITSIIFFLIILRSGKIVENNVINRTNINVQNLTILAARERKKELFYMAAYLVPHTSSELSMDDIKALCDDLFEAHKDWLPEYK